MLVGKGLCCVIGLRGKVSGCCSTSFLKPLTDLLELPGEVSSLFLNLGPSSSLSLNLLLQLLNASLDLMTVTSEKAID